MMRLVGALLALVIVGAVVGAVVLFVSMRDLVNRIPVCEVMTGPDAARIFESAPLLCKDPGIGRVRYTNRTDPQTITIEAGVQVSESVDEAKAAYAGALSAPREGTVHDEAVTGVGDEAFWSYSQTGGKVDRGRVEWRHGKTTGAVTFLLVQPQDTGAEPYKARCIEAAQRLIKAESSTVK